MSVKQASGFALAEVVIAAAIFALTAMVVTGFYLTASARGVLGRNVTAGAMLAQQRMEVVQARAYSSLPVLGATETLDELGNGTPSGRFTRVTTVTTPVLGTPNLTQIQVTVTWTEPYAQKSVTLYTLRVSP